MVNGIHFFLDRLQVRTDTIVIYLIVVGVTDSL